MPRPKGLDGKVVHMREELEGAVLALVDGQEVAPLVRLRIVQAIERSGLSLLLEPALDDLGRLIKDLVEAEKLIGAATRHLME